MRICVVTLFTEEIEVESKLSTLNKKKYCEKYGIDYRFFYGRASERHAQWDKIQCLIQTLPEYDYVVWMDSDTVFNNFDKSLSDLIKNNQQYDSLFCSDVCYTEGVTHLMVNTGVMVFKNTDWSSNLLNKVWNSVKDYSIHKLDKHSYDGFPHEQGKMCEELTRENTDKFKIFPSTEFNTHPNTSNNETFVIHYMGSRQSESHLSTFIDSVKKINNRLGIDEKESFDVIELKKLNICVVSHFTENITNVANITIPNKEEYSKKHNYDFKYHKGRLSNRHPGWDKIVYLKEILSTNKYDYVVWIDNDAYITNPEIRFDFICNNDPDKKLIIASEDNYRTVNELSSSLNYNELHNLRIINTGVFILKNDEWSIKFLNDVWETKSNTNSGVNSSHKEILDGNFNYDYWPFEQGPIHIVLSKSNNEDYKIVKSEILNKFRNVHKKHNFICHFVGEGSNDVSIKSYVESLSDKDNGVLIKDLDVLVPFKGNDVLLKVKIYQQSELYTLKYIWDFSKTGEENLSHSFQIINGTTKRQIDFNSEFSGSFEFRELNNIKINHSYDWFGEYEWKQIV
jgi:hypothetical protein